MAKKAKEQEDSTFRSFSALMEEMDRGDALDEAIFSALETAMSLIKTRNERGAGQTAGDLELLRQALASARATVVASGYLLTAAADAARRRT